MLYINVSINVYNPKFKVKEKNKTNLVITKYKYTFKKTFQNKKKKEIKNINAIK